LIQQYLALGDSYTIGEGVALFDSFPYQLVQRLRSMQLDIAAPEIVAKTGFTAAELLHQANQTKFLKRYQLVTLLVGVNDQYRGQPVSMFETSFNNMLDLALSRCDQDASRLYVLTIPDYSISPFACDFDRPNISKEISSFNDAIRRMCSSRSVAVADITLGHSDQTDQSLFAEDGLHPAPVEYGRWVKLLLETINLNILQQ